MVGRRRPSGCSRTRDWLAVLLVAAGCRVEDAGTANRPSSSVPPAGAAGEGGVPAEPEQSDAGDAGAAGGGGEGGHSACTVKVCDGAACEAPLGDGDCSNPWRLLGPGALESGWAAREVSGDTRCGTPAVATECAQRGASYTFELDLADAETPVELTLVLDAAFDGSLRLEHGECIDSVVEACNLDHAEGVDRAVVTAEVEPGRYRVVVAGENDGDQGTFRLSARANAPGARCLTAPSNDACDGAIDLDPTLAVQTVVGSTRCARNDAFSFFECHFYDSVPDVFYRLDLSDRTEPVVVRLSTDLPPTNFDTLLYVFDGVHGRCSSPIDCNDDGPEHDDAIPTSSELIAELAPGEYFFVVDGVDDGGDFGLRVSLDELECGGHDTCDGALELDPSDGQRTVPADFVCAASSRLTTCGAWDYAADVYYRLDLSEREGLVRVQAAIDDGFSLALLAAAEGGACGTELLCEEEEISLTLEPKLYYIMASAGRGTRRRAELSIGIEGVESGELEGCVNAEIERCANDDYLSHRDCCSESALGCVQRYTSCGLDPSVTSCVCSTQPGCCDVSIPARECWPVFEACGLFCDDFDHAAFCAEEDR